MHGVAAPGIAAPLGRTVALIIHHASLLQLFPAGDGAPDAVGNQGDHEDQHRNHHRPFPGDFIERLAGDLWHDAYEIPDQRQGRAERGRTVQFFQKAGHHTPLR